MRTGDKVQGPCTISCAACHTPVEFKKPGVIRRCAKCGNTSYDTVTGRLEVPGTDAGREK